MCVGEICPYHTTSTRVWGVVPMLAEKTCYNPSFSKQVPKMDVPRVLAQSCSRVVVKFHTEPFAPFPLSSSRTTMIMYTTQHVVAPHADARL